MFKVGDGMSETVLFITVSLVVPNWFRENVLGALSAMTNENNWIDDGTATIDYAVDKSVEMMNSIAFSDVNPLPIMTIPTGTITIYSGTGTPAHWLRCEGGSVLRATYPELFAVIGTIYGSVDGTHFTLPDFRKNFPVGMFHLAPNYEMGDKGGEDSHVLTAAEMPLHTHTGVVSAINPISNRALVATGGAQTVQPAGTSNSAGGGGAHENRPPYIAMPFIIFTGQI